MPTRRCPYPYALRRWLHFDSLLSKIDDSEGSEFNNLIPLAAEQEEEDRGRKRMTDSSKRMSRHKQVYSKPSFVAPDINDPLASRSILGTAEQDEGR